MLIPFDLLSQVVKDNDITVTGVFHLGAHECEEMWAYEKLGVSQQDIVWVDAIHSNVTRATRRGVPNVYNAVITDKDNDTVVFNVSNNVQSSSVLEFGTHALEHPQVKFVDKIEMDTITVNTFLDGLPMDAKKLNFWNFDIQGAELMALRGSLKYLCNADILYLEVNEKPLYKGCGLMTEVDAFLTQHSFQRVVTKMTPHGWGDAIYVKNPLT